MSGVEVLLVGAVIGGFTNLLTDGINPLLQIARTAVRCEGECRKLADVVESIKKDVEHILRLLGELQDYDPNATQDLRLLVNLVKKLKEELHLADIDMHVCNTASKIGKKLGSYRLSKKITAHNDQITALGKELVQVNLHLKSMLDDAKFRRSSFDMHQRLSNLELQHASLELQHTYGASSQLQQQPSILDLQRWSRETEDILQREESTRLSQRLQNEYSLYGCYDSTRLYADGSSQHSSHHSSHHLNHTTSSQYDQSFTNSAHLEAHNQWSHITQTHDHMTHSEAVQVPLQDPYVPHLLLNLH